MENKLLMMKGLPGSGKSTWAKEYISNTPRTVIVSKDNLREMLHNNVFNIDNEKITRESQKMLVRGLLSNNLSVIVDDTNMNPRDEESWRSIAQEQKVYFETRYIDTAWDECIKNDNKREGTSKYVGESVIIDMAMRNGLIDEVPTILCDIDGTLANIEHRRHFVRPPVTDVQGTFVKDWKSFFAHMDKDTLREDVCSILQRHLIVGHRIILVSARPEEYRKVTEQWLLDNDVPYFHLIMRKTGDKRPDTEVKQEILDRYFTDKKLIVRVIDDRPSVIRMWESNGLSVIDVGDGDEF